MRICAETQVHSLAPLHEIKDQASPLLKVGFCCCDLCLSAVLGNLELLDRATLGASPSTHALRYRARSVILSHADVLR